MNLSDPRRLEGMSGWTVVATNSHPVQREPVHGHLGGPGDPRVPTAMRRGLTESGHHQEEVLYIPARLSDVYAELSAWTSIEETLQAVGALVERYGASGMTVLLTVPRAVCEAAIALGAWEWPAYRQRPG